MDTLAKVPEYVYQPLQGPTWIRIVCLHPSTDFDAPLQCDIHHFDRDAVQYTFGPGSEYYDAVSYFWGQPDFSRKLLCNSDRVLPITSNVDLMLRRLRSTSKLRRLWVDAISLHQAGKEEIQQQVPLMGAIFRQATKVRIWAGEAEEDVVKVSALFRVLLGLPSTPDQAKMSTILFRIFGTTSSTAITSFLHLPWFRRQVVILKARFCILNDLVDGFFKRLP